MEYEGWSLKQLEAVIEVAQQKLKAAEKENDQAPSADNRLTLASTKAKVAQLVSAMEMKKVYSGLPVYEVGDVLEMRRGSGKWDTVKVVRVSKEKGYIVNVRGENRHIAFSQVLEWLRRPRGEGEAAAPPAAAAAAATGSPEPEARDPATAPPLGRVPPAAGRERVPDPVDAAAPAADPFSAEVQAAAASGAGDDDARRRQEKKEKKEKKAERAKKRAEKEERAKLRAEEERAKRQAEEICHQVMLRTAAKRQAEEEEKAKRRAEEERAAKEKADAADAKGYFDDDAKDGAAAGGAMPEVPDENVVADLADHWARLGVGFEADEETVKRSFRKLAARLHPDRPQNKGNDEAQRRFQLVQEAYGVLGDPEKRRKHMERIARGGKRDRSRSPVTQRQRAGPALPGMAETWREGGERKRQAVAAQLDKETFSEGLKPRSAPPTVSLAGAMPTCLETWRALNSANVQSNLVGTALRPGGLYPTPTMATGSMSARDGSRCLGVMKKAIVRSGTIEGTDGEEYQVQARDCAQGRLPGVGARVSFSVKREGMELRAVAVQES